VDNVHDFIRSVLGAEKELADMDKRESGLVSSAIFVTVCFRRFVMPWGVCLPPQNG
jgi:hypothetical protein